MIEVEAGQMTVYATDGNMQVSVRQKVECVCEKAIRVTLSAKRLNDICRTLPRGERITFYAAPNWVYLRSDMASFQLLCLPSEEFPRLASDDGVGQTNFTVDQSDTCHQFSIFFSPSLKRPEDWAQLYQMSHVF